MRQAEIYRKGIFAGTLTEDGGDYRFCYDEAYLTREDAQSVSLTLPLQAEAFVSPVLFPFFDGLIPEGWLLDIARCIYTLRTGDVIAKTQAGLRALEEHLFPDEEPLRKTLEIRQNPRAFTGTEELNGWLKSLGPVVQRYADVLEQELQRA